LVNRGGGGASPRVFWQQDEERAGRGKGHQRKKKDAGVSKKTIEKPRPTWTLSFGVKMGKSEVRAEAIYVTSSWTVREGREILRRGGSLKVSRVRPGVKSRGNEVKSNSIEQHRH